MKINLSLSELQRLICENGTCKEFVLTSDNQNFIPVHIDYELTFKEMKIRPDRNEIKFADGGNYFMIRCVREIVLRDISAGFGWAIDVYSRNYDDNTAPHKYKILVQ